MPRNSINKDRLPQIFETINNKLSDQNEKITVTLLGGIAILLGNFRDRVTLDFDIIPSPDTDLFIKICREINIPVDVVSIVSTVDLNESVKKEYFKGSHLTVNAISSTDLIKTKLERFYKQDPEDIYAIIDSLNLDYDKFQEIVKEMLIVYVGDNRFLKLSAAEVVERKYPEKIKEFKQIIK